ncbi:MAG: class I SAM-dependent methyltransferase [Armatimonadetes bacterium]|nr:class I SAM-dependent methyltransferase [Armatimonadota bacterium]MDE2207964.1 class I SAM-dependent methyltransferase [Armatimonadota bacterium]
MNEPEYQRMYRLEDSYWWFAGRRQLVESLIARFAPSTQAGRSILLDVGCGTGAMSFAMQRWGHVVSLDFTHLALQFAARRGLSGMLQADALAIPLKSESVDVVVALDVLEHLPHDRPAVDEFMRVLRPGGVVVATVPADPRLWSEHDVALMHYRRYRIAEVGSLFGDAGFVWRKLAHCMTLLYPVVRVQRTLSARRPPNDPPQAALPMVPPFVNNLLRGILWAENKVAERVRLPFGLTIVCVVQKPQSTVSGLAAPQTPSA